MNKILSKRMYDFSKYADIMQTILIFLIAFLVPTFLSGILKTIFGETSLVATNSQLIIGTIVNTALIISALNLKGWKKILGVITMPSISTILSGYVFSSASPLMVYMIPGIWLGNFTLIYLYKLILLPLIIISFKDEHPPNTSYPICISSFSIITDSNSPHP